MNPITDIWRGNCPCGKWLIILPKYTRARPWICHGPCHANARCGRRWFIEDGKPNWEDPTP